MTSKQALQALAALIANGRLKVDASGITLNADLENVKLKNQADAGINPATEEKQTLANSLLATLQAVTGAATSDAAVYGDATGSIKAALRGLACSLYAVGDGTGDKPGVLLAAINTAVSTLKAATDLLAASGGGGYVRQDSTATIAKESGGNLAAILAKLIAAPSTEAKQDTGNIALAAIQTAAEAVQAAIQSLAGDDLTNHGVTEVDVAAGARVTIKAATALKKTYAMEYTLIAEADNTIIRFMYDDDGAGTNETEIREYLLPYKGSSISVRHSRSEFAPATASGKHLTLTATTGNVNGYVGYAVEL